MADEKQDPPKTRGLIVPEPIFPGHCPPLKRAEAVLKRVDDENKRFERMLEESRSARVPD